MSSCYNAVMHNACAGSGRFGLGAKHSFEQPRWAIKKLLLYLFDPRRANRNRLGRELNNAAPTLLGCRVGMGHGNGYGALDCGDACSWCAAGVGAACNQLVSAL